MPDEPHFRPVRHTLGRAAGSRMAAASMSAGAERAQRVLNSYRQIVGASRGTTATLVRDILTDLGHLCRQEGMDWESMCRGASAWLEVER